MQLSANRPQPAIDKKMKNNDGNKKRPLLPQRGLSSAKSSEDQKRKGHHFRRGPIFRKIK